MSLLLMLDKVAGARGDGLLPELRAALGYVPPVPRLEIVNLETAVAMARDNQVVLTSTDEKLAKTRNG